MRINLDCPYNEKEEAKRLGARWDYEQRVWYVIDPSDLKPFYRWLKVTSRTVKPKSNTHGFKLNHHGFKGKTTGPKVFQPFCDCQTPPWEDCEHSERLAMEAMQEMGLLSELPF